MSEILTKEERAEIAERASHATQGPWTRKKPERDASGFYNGVGVAGTAGRQMVYAPLGGSFPSADCDFIAHARTDIPALLATCDALEAERDAERALTAQMREAMRAVQRKTADILAYYTSATVPTTDARKISRPAIVPAQPDGQKDVQENV